MMAQYHKYTQVSHGECVLFNQRALLSKLLNKPWYHWVPSDVIGCQLCIPVFQWEKCPDLLSRVHLYLLSYGLIIIMHCILLPEKQTYAYLYKYTEIALGKLHGLSNTDTMKNAMAGPSYIRTGRWLCFQYITQNIPRLLSACITVHF